ncbi:MAG: FMN-binding protein [Prevotella sp.]|nr:FMN-binding protein [Prevotella sp.]
MKKVISILALFSLVVVLSSAKGDDGVMTKENGMYVVNTTTLGKDVIGYVGATPLKIYIQKDKIVKVEALKNQETPKYNARVKRLLLTKWDGMKVKDVSKQKVDGVTGATITSDAFKKNVQLGVDYYLKHK